MIKNVLLALSFLSIVAAVVVINPMLRGKGQVTDFLLNSVRSTDLAVLLYQKTEEAGAVQFLYRGNAQRSGQVHLHRSMPEEITLESVTEKMNFGVHTASKSSVAVDVSGFYFGSDEGRFFAYDFPAKLRWQINAISSVRGIHGTAITDELYVYIGNYRGHLLCIRKSDGKIMWDAVIADAIGTSPLLVDEFLYVTAEFNGKGSLVAKLSRKTGEKIWVSEIFSDQSHSSPVISEEGRIVVVGDNTGTLRGLNAKTGMRVWREKLSGEIKGTPVVSQGNVFVGSWGKDFCSFNVLSGEKNWCRTMSGLVQSSASIEPLSGDLIVQTSSKASLMRLRAQDGKVVWQQNYVVGTRVGISSPVVLVDNRKQTRILAGCAKKDLCVLDSETGRIHSTVSLPETFSAVPTVFDDNIYLPLDQGGVAQIHVH